VVALGELTFNQVPAELYGSLFREFPGLYQRNGKAYAYISRERTNMREHLAAGGTRTRQHADTGHIGGRTQHCSGPWQIGCRPFG